MAQLKDTTVTGDLVVTGNIKVSGTLNGKSIITGEIDCTEVNDIVLFDETDDTTYVKFDAFTDIVKVEATSGYQGNYIYISYYNTSGTYSYFSPASTSGSVGFCGQAPTLITNGTGVVADLSYGPIKVENRIAMPDRLMGFRLETTLLS